MNQENQQINTAQPNNVQNAQYVQPNQQYMQQPQYMAQQPNQQYVQQPQYMAQQPNQQQYGHQVMQNGGTQTMVMEQPYVQQPQVQYVQQPVFQHTPSILESNQNLLQADPNAFANQVQKQAQQLVSLSVNDTMKQMANNHDTVVATDLSAFSPEEQKHILNKSQAITEYIMSYDPSKHGHMYLHDIVLASDAQNNKIMQSMNGKAEIMQRTLSDLSSDKRNAQHTEAMTIITEILNENQGSGTMIAKLRKFMKNIPILGKLFNTKIIPLLQEMENGKKTIDQVLTEIHGILTNTEKQLEDDIKRLVGVKDQLQIAKRELRKQSAITEQAIAMVMQRMQGLSEEHQKAITEMVLSPLSSQLSINTQKIGISSQYVIAVETGIDGNKILATTSKETREVCIYGLRLSFMLDSTLGLQEKAIKQQVGVRDATDKMLLNNAKRLNQNIQATARLAGSPALNLQTFQQTSQMVMDAANKLSEIKRDVFANNMRSNEEILAIEKQLNKFSKDKKDQLVKEGLGVHSSSPTGNASNSNALQGLFS